MINNKHITCCFTGHRRLPKDKTQHIVKRLDQEVETLISQGVTDFISGGALEFDQIAASLIVSKKERGSNIRLMFALPCRNQDERWSLEQKRAYQELLSVADEIIYVSEDYTDDCMKKRNQYMVDRSDYCICALLHGHSGTGQTVNYARKKGHYIMNTAKN